MNARDPEVQEQIRAEFAAGIKNRFIIEDLSKLYKVKTEGIYFIVGCMPEFRKVSIKMAKMQNLSLNPGKISGLCGRLM
jgi:hypothetical protein